MPATAHLEHDSTSYTIWLARVNTIIINRTGLEADDLPDFCYADAFEDGMTPSEAARAAIAEA